MKKLSAPHEYICGLDIGTTKIVTVIAEPDEGNGLRLTGLGCVPSRGLRRGVVINLEQTSSDIEESLRQAVEMAGVSVHTVWAGLAGEHVKSFNSRGAIPISKMRGEPTGEVTNTDVERVIDAARAIALPDGSRVLHVLPQEFMVDSERGIHHPIGMAGVRLVASVHIVTGAISSVQNILTCCRRAGVSVAELVLEPLASAASVLTADERELGVILLDIGGGTTDMAVFHSGVIRHTAVIACGGDYITRDIAVGLRTPVESAEKIKIEHGAAHRRAIDQNDFLEIPGVGGRNPKSMSRSTLVSIIAPRIEEIFTLAREELIKTRTLDYMGAGVVLTGGSAAMPGMAEIAEETFALPVRIGSPRETGPDDDLSLGPKYATAVGILYHAIEQGLNRTKKYAENGSLLTRASGRLKNWFQEAF